MHTGPVLPHKWAQSPYSFPDWIQLWVTTQNQLSSMKVKYIHTHFWWQVKITFQNVMPEVFVD
jgi:hypothetical protein